MYSIIFYVFPVFLLLSACLSAGSSSTLTPVATPSHTPTITITATAAPAASPTVVAGSFADFYLFAANIDAALQDKDTSFFEEHAAASVWNCLGDETYGVCKDIPPDTSLKGIPIAYDWVTYQVYSPESYKETWQSTFAGAGIPKLVAVANQFGDNPLMPMAGQSFLAIIGLPKEGDQSSIQEVRVLFFEYYEQTWHIAGELVSAEAVQSWIQDTCSTCYDLWEAWPNE